MSTQYSNTQKEILCSLNLDDDLLNLDIIKDGKERQRIINNPRLLRKVIAAKKVLYPDVIDLEIKVDDFYKEAILLQEMLGGEKNLKKAAENYQKIIDDTIKRQEISNQAKKWQQDIAGELVEKLKNDIEHVAYDPNKIRKYEKQSGKVKEKEISKDKFPLLKTQTFYNFTGWFNSARVFFLRCDRFLKNYGLGFLPGFFNLFGLSYLAEFVFDLGVILWSTFRPLRVEEETFMEKNGVSKPKIYWYRFKNVVTKDDRLPRMLNAAVWFSINLTAFILTGGIGASFVAPAITILLNKINIGGFIFDFLNESYKGIRDYVRHRSTLKAVEKDTLELINKKIQLVNEIIEMRKNAPHEEKNKEDLKNKQKEIKKLDLEIEARELVKSRLEKKIKYHVVAKSVYNITLITTVIIGAGLLFFPPTTIAGVCVIAASLTVLLAGSVLNNFGKRIWNKIWDSTKDSNLKLDGSAKIQHKGKTNSYTKHFNVLLPTANNECGLNMLFAKNSAKLPKDDMDVTVESPKLKTTGPVKRSSRAINLFSSPTTTINPTKILSAIPLKLSYAKRSKTL